MIVRILLLIKISFLFCTNVYALDEYYLQWDNYAKSQKRETFQKWVTCLFQSEWVSLDCQKPQDMPNSFGKNGIFFTLTKRYSVRGCFGALHHKTHDLERVLKEYIHGAVMEDPRYDPISQSEISDLDWKLTITSDPQRVTDPDRLNFKKFAIMFINNRNQSLVYVPGEIRNQERLKKIINENKVVEMYYFKAIVFKGKGDYN